jgi:hypothetical protein
MHRPARSLTILAALTTCGVATALAACSGPGPEATDAGVDAGSATDSATVLDSGVAVDSGANADASSSDSGVSTDSGTADSGSSACIEAPSLGRGVLQVALTTAGAGAAGAPVSVGALCSKLYIASGGSSGARPWEGGTLTSCTVGNCAATTAAIAVGDLQFPARFTRDGNTLLAYGRVQPFSLGTGPLDTPGDVLKITHTAPAQNLGPLLDPLAGAGSSFGNVYLRGTTLFTDYKTYHNHGDYRGAVVVENAAGAPVVTGISTGGEVSGYRAEMSPTRAFSVSQGRGSSAFFALPAPAALTQVPVSTLYGFLKGERFYGVSYPASGAAAYTQLTCESDTTCAAPVIIANAALPAYTTEYLGAFGDDLVFRIASAANPLIGDLKACKISTWSVSACVPETLAAGVTLPTSLVSSDGASIYYVAAGNVMRLGL